MDRTKEVVSAFPELQTRVHQKYLERMKRTYHILQGFNPFLADEVFNQRREHTRQKTRRPEEAAAVIIQTRYRGYLARKLYGEMMYARYEAEEEKARLTELRRVEEGMLLLESIQLQKSIKEKQFLSRQRDIERNFAAIVIQRNYRRWKHFPLPLSAINVIPGDSATMLELPVCEEPKSQWARPAPDELDLSRVSDPGDESDSDSEVFGRLHPVSRDSAYVFEALDPLLSSGRLDLPSEDEFNRTASSVLSSDLRSLSNTGDFSMTQYMRKSEPTWGGPQALPTLRSELTGVTTRSRLACRDELREKSISALRRRGEWLEEHITSLRSSLCDMTAKRESLLDGIEFSKKLIGFLTSL